eukprot:TRINITY_DN6264_c0_g1_i1.p1 TRINITY_DN6264_c0_g1~~TRINITY_DN6264_c0_g1_i1.p1  ORF type:complete len:152 (-),score=19.64 TRINITY_DN6264_c0_g1_i1:149-604(-)
MPASSSSATIKIISGLNLKGRGKKRRRISLRIQLQSYPSKKRIENKIGVQHQREKNKEEGEKKKKRKVKSRKQKKIDNRMGGNAWTERVSVASNFMIERRRRSRRIRKKALLEGFIIEFNWDVGGALVAIACAVFFVSFLFLKKRKEETIK